ncbi:MAG TPA: RHS repeat-associated core domain-containing protein, partial [Acidobacteriota bacterium]|nr:RHS repeat-associated core domain-containing protein [Acidobacteriota bacterium]
IELYPLAANTMNEKFKFTNQERDYSTGLDYFHARYYCSAMGRFMEADRTGALNERLVMPQLLNKYVYCRNNPLTFADPNGLLEIRSNELGHGATDRHSYEVTFETQSKATKLLRKVGPKAASMMKTCFKKILGIFSYLDTGLKYAKDYSVGKAVKTDTSKLVGEMEKTGDAFNVRTFEKAVKDKLDKSNVEPDSVGNYSLMQLKDIQSAINTTADELFSKEGAKLVKEEYNMEKLSTEADSKSKQNIWQDGPKESLEKHGL